MFDLEQSIADWRRQMLAAGIKTPVPLEELESHLQEDIAKLLKAGKSEAEAFKIAVSRVGNPGTVATEFRKSDGAAATPLIIGWLVWAGACALLLAALFEKLFSGKLSLLLVTHIFTLTAGYGAAFLAGGFGIYYVYCWRFRDSSSAREQVLSRATFLFTQLAAALVAVGFVLGVFWSHQNRGQYLTGDPREIGAAVAAVWLLALLMIQRVGLLRDRVALLLSIVGNMIVGFAWFGAGSMAHGYGIGGYWPLNVVLGAHLLFLAIGIIPMKEATEA